MALSSDDFRGHPIWSSCDDASRRIGEALTNSSSEEATLLTQLRFAVAAVERLKELEPWRFPSDGDVLEQLKSVIDQVASSAQELIDDPTLSVDAELTAHLNAIATALLHAPVPAVTSGHLSGIASVAEDYTRAVENAIEAMRGRVEDAQEAVAEFEESRRIEEEKLRAAFAEIKAEVGQTNESVTAQAGRIDTAIVTQTNTFTQNQEKWSQDVGEAIKAAASEAEEQRREQAADAEALIDELHQLKHRSQKMVSATSRFTISANYGAYAVRQGLAGTFWSVTAVGLAVTGLVLLMNLVKDFAHVTTADAIFKATISSAVLGTAAFMAREAAGHRREARDAKRTQLDMNTLEPYLQTLPENEAEKLRTLFAYRIFGRPLANDRSQQRIDLVQLKRSLFEDGEGSSDTPDSLGAEG